MGHITGSMCSAGALINMQEEMTSQGQESSVLCIDVDEYESMLDGWKKHSSTPVMCLKCQSQPLDRCGASSDTGGIKSPATLLLIDSSDRERAQMIIPCRASIVLFQGQLGSGWEKAYLKTMKI